MFREGLLDSNKNEKKTGAVQHRHQKKSIDAYKPKCAFYNTPHHFAWYGKNTSMHELTTFECDIYPINSSPNKLYYRKQ